MVDQNTPSSNPTPEELKEWLKPVEDPELFMSLVDLGLIYHCEWKPSADATQGPTVRVEMTLTSPGCPAGDYLVTEVKKRMMAYPSTPAILDTTVDIVWEPKWDPNTMASEECKETLGLW